MFFHVSTLATVSNKLFSAHIDKVILQLYTMKHNVNVIFQGKEEILSCIAATWQNWQASPPIFYLKHDVNVNIDYAWCFLSMKIMYCRCIGKHPHEKEGDR